MRRFTSILFLALVMLVPSSVFAFTDYLRVPSDFTNDATPDTTFTFEFEVNPDSVWNYHKFVIFNMSEVPTYGETCIASTGTELITDNVIAPVDEYVAVTLEEYSDATCDTFENQLVLEDGSPDPAFEVISTSVASSTATSTDIITVAYLSSTALMFFFISLILTLWIWKSFMP